MNKLLFIGIGLLLGGGSCLQMQTSNLHKKHLYLLPEAYSGVVFIEFNKKESYPPLHFNDSTLTIMVTDSGIVETSTKYNDFANFSSWSDIQWKNAPEDHPFELKNRNYGFFQTKENSNVDTIFDSEGNILEYSMSGSAKDFNYVCFYVNYNQEEISWDSLITRHIAEKKDCESIIERRKYLIE